MLIRVIALKGNIQFHKIYNSIFLKIDKKTFIYVQICLLERFIFLIVQETFEVIHGGMPWSFINGTSQHPKLGQPDKFA